MATIVHLALDQFSVSYPPLPAVAAVENDSFVSSEAA